MTNYEGTRNAIVNAAIRELDYTKKWILEHPSQDNTDISQLINMVTALEAYKIIGGRADIPGYDVAYVMRLMEDLYNGFPLSPIEDIPEIWHEVWKTEDSTENKDTARSMAVTYQCSRYSPLFKTVHNDGRIEFDDVSRCEGHDDEAPEGCTFTSGRIRKLVNQYYPITMPYTPPRKPYIVECRQFKYDENDNKNDWDTQAFFFIKDPYTLEETNLNIFERLNTATDDWESISKDEYIERLKTYIDRMRNSWLFKSG